MVHVPLMTNDTIEPTIFGAAIRQRRRVLGIGQAKLAMLMGWSRQRLCDLEAGRHAAPVQSDIHKVLAAALRWPVTKVRELVMLERNEMRLDVDTVEKQHVARLIVGMWDDLTPALREKIEALVQPAMQAAHERIALMPGISLDAPVDAPDCDDKDTDATTRAESPDSE